MSRTFAPVLAGLCMLVSACSTAGNRMPALRSAETQTIHAGAVLTLSVPSGQSHIHRVHVVVEVANRSRHVVYVYGYPIACAVPGGNPTVLVLDDQGTVLNPPTFTGARCPAPPSYALAPGHTVGRRITVDLRGMWLKATVILSSETGLQHTIETRRLHMVYRAAR